MKTYKIGKCTFETFEAKESFMLRSILGDLEYIGKETKLSETENGLRKCAISDLKKILKNRK